MVKNSINLSILLIVYAQKGVTDIKRKAFNFAELTIATQERCNVSGILGPSAKQSFVRILNTTYEFIARSVP